MDLQFFTSLVAFRLRRFCPAISNSNSSLHGQVVISLEEKRQKEVKGNFNKVKIPFRFQSGHPHANLLAWKQ